MGTAMQICTTAFIIRFQSYSRVERRDCLLRNFAAPPPSQSWDLDGLFLWEMNFTVIIIQETLKFKLSKYLCCAVRVCCLTKRGSVRNILIRIRMWVPHLSFWFESYIEFITILRTRSEYVGQARTRTLAAPCCMMYSMTLFHHWRT